MTGRMVIRVAIAKTCFWDGHDDPKLAYVSGRQGVVWVIRAPDDTETYEAAIGGTTAQDERPMPLDQAPDLEKVVAILNDRLAEYEAGGARPADDGPTRIDLDAVKAKLPETQKFIDGEIARWEDAPPPTPEVDEETKRELLRIAFQVLTKGKGTDKELRAALTDAEAAIRQLPCDGCGGIHWPIVDKPETGSVDWWIDPDAYFACRTCDEYLADGFAYPYIRQAEELYPLKGVLPSKKEREAFREDEIVRFRGDQATDDS